MYFVLSIFNDVFKFDNAEKPPSSICVHWPQQNFSMFLLQVIYIFFQFENYNISDSPNVK